MSTTRKDFKTERNQKIYEEYKTSDSSFNKLAKKYSLTPQRIAAIVKNIDEKVLEGGITTKESREAYKNLAVEKRENGQLANAAKMFEKVINWDKENNNPKGLADALGHQRITYTLMADRAKTKREKLMHLEKSKKLVAQAVKALAKVKNPKESLAIQNIHLASVLRKQAQLTSKEQMDLLLKEAIANLNKSLKALPGSEAHKAWPLGMKAAAEYSLGQKEVALETLALAQKKLYGGYTEEISLGDQGRIKLRVWNTGIMLRYAKIYAAENMPFLAEVYAGAVIATPDPENILKNRKREAKEILKELS